MASSFSSLSYHVIFAPKFRRRTISPTWRDELYNYIADIIDNHDGKLLEIGGVEDHVHLLLAISPKIAVADMIRLIKANSSKWITTRARQRSFSGRLATQRSP